jgi:hypothetical protein
MTDEKLDNIFDQLEGRIDALEERLDKCQVRDDEDDKDMTWIMHSSPSDFEPICEAEMNEYFCEVDGCHDGSHDDGGHSNAFWQRVQYEPGSNDPNFICNNCMSMLIQESS